MRRCAVLLQHQSARGFMHEYTLIFTVMIVCATYRMKCPMHEACTYKWYTKLYEWMLMSQRYVQTPVYSPKYVLLLVPLVYVVVLAD
jgi:hypothetical protein